MSTLTINVKNGFLQKSYDILGAMENFVVLKLIINGQTVSTVKTRIAKGQKRTPIVWNESFNFNVPKHSWGTAVLQVTIFDEDVTENELCATGKINLEHCGFFLQQNVTIPYNIRLYGQNNSEVAGELTFTSNYA